MTEPPGRESYGAVGMLLNAANTVELDLATNERQDNRSDEHMESLTSHDNQHPKQPRPSAHQCPTCHRTYERADHLTRHLKSHENARQFQCQSCQKSFNRHDLLHRHVATHVRHARSGSPHIKRTERAARACIACATAKARCEDKKPCRRCRTRKIACEAANPQSYFQEDPVPATATTVTNNRPPTPPDNTPVILNDGYDNRACHLTVRTPRTSGDIPHTSSDINYSAIGQEINGPVSVEIFQPDGPSYEIIHPPLGEHQMGFNTAVDEMLSFFPPTHFNNQNLDFGFNDFDFQDESFGIYPAIQKHVTIDNAVSLETANITARNGRDVSRGHAAFTRSPWLWTPASKDYILSDQGNLALDEESIPSTLTPTSSVLRSGSAYGGSLSIDTGMRDKMFYLVSTMSMNKYATGTPKFPSLYILNSIIEVFFVRQGYQIDAWIHVPTIAMADGYPEFLIALVAGGSRFISMPAIWKMGLALLDVVRVTVAEFWEKENSRTRKLQPLQAWMLFLDTGLWSGFQRQMELAESFAQPMITMMRRGGILSAPPDTGALIPKDSDTGQILEVKWRTWAQRESFKRLSLHLFLHDSRASISLQKNPLVSFTELSFSVPASRDLFLANSAEQWKSRYMELNSAARHPLPRLVDCMRDPHILDDVCEASDINLCYMALLYGFWNQIWAFREACKFHGIDDILDSAHTIWLTTQQRELYREISIFKDNLEGIPGSRQEFILTAELLLMLLHVSSEELQRFAGKSGEEAAAQSMASLERWSFTEQSRRAVWHAGQVFRWALSMPPAELRDFYTIAVYFASLTMWAYGHLSSSAGKDIPPGSKSGMFAHGIRDSPPPAVLNGSESLEMQAFILKGLGKPVLVTVASSMMGDRSEVGNATFIALNDPNSVLNMACDLYRSNFPFLEEPLPPLVENIGKLMRELSNLPESRFSRCTSPAER